MHLMHTKRAVNLYGKLEFRMYKELRSGSYWRIKTVNINR